MIEVLEPYTPKSQPRPWALQAVLEGCEPGEVALMVTGPRGKIHSGVRVTRASLLEFAEKLVRELSQ
jgi:hypothetical protein